MNTLKGQTEPRIRRTEDQPDFYKMNAQITVWCTVSENMSNKTLQINYKKKKVIERKENKEPRK